MGVVVEAARVSADLRNRLDGADRPPEKSRPLAPWQSAQYSPYKALPRAASSGTGRERVCRGLVLFRAQPIGGEAQRFRGRSGSAPRRSRTRRCGCAPRHCRCCRPNAAASPLPRVDLAAIATESRRCRPIPAAAVFRWASSSSAFAGPNVSKRPGPGVTSWPRKRNLLARQDHAYRIAGTAMYCSSSRRAQRIILAGARGGLHDLPRVEALVERAVGQELRKPSEIDVVGRHPRQRRPACSAGFRGRSRRDRRRSSARCGRTPACAASNAGRPIHPRLEDKAERLPALAGQVVAAQLRQRLEDAGRNASEPVAAGRAVFELLHRVVEMLFGDVAMIIVIEIRGGRDDKSARRCPEMRQRRRQTLRNTACDFSSTPQPARAGAGEGDHRLSHSPGQGARLRHGSDP